MLMQRLGVTVTGILAVVALCNPLPAHATKFYVRASGDDASDGRSPGRALATITAAASRAGGDDMVIVGPGTYAEGDIKPDGNGRNDEPVIFYADKLGQLTGDVPGEVIIDATGFENGFRLSSRPWVIVNGFTVMNAKEDGIYIKSTSDNCVVANCRVLSNGGRGVRVEDSVDVIVYNNLIYANQGNGVDFSGDGSVFRPDEGSPRGIVINNTIYRNSDGIRIEAVLPSKEMTVLNNVISENSGIGLNLKEESKDGFVGQWNLNTDGYKTLDASRGRLDLDEPPLLVAPAGVDHTLGESGHGDDDFRLRQVAAGQSVESSAVDASAIKARKLVLNAGSTRTDGRPDRGRTDLGFHSGNIADFRSRFQSKKSGPVFLIQGQRRFSRTLKKLRKLAARCEIKMERARDQRRAGKGPCVNRSARAKLIRKCGGAVEMACE
jgi:parallel beta-helix repeat protein